MIRGLLLAILPIIAFGQDQILHLSNWTKVLDASNYTASYLSFSSGAISDSGTVVFTERSGFALTSSDGTTWQSNRISSVIGGVDYVCKFINGQFLLGGGYDENPDTGGTLTELSYSVDGINWTINETTDWGGAINGIAYGNGQYLARSDFDYFYRSSDGRAWTKDAAQINFGALDLAFGHGLFVTCAIHFQPYTSTDGTRWLGRNDPSGSDGSGSVIFGNGSFLMNFRAYLPLSLIWSRDGIDWKLVPDFPHFTNSGGIGPVTFGKGRFFGITADHRAAHSFDGFNWTIIGEIPPPTTGPRVRVLVAGNGRLYGAAEDGIYASPEFTTLLPNPDNPKELQLYGRAGSTHRLEYLSDGIGPWLTLRDVTIGTNGVVTIPDWTSAQPTPTILRARSLE